MILYREYAPCSALAPFVACLWTCDVRPGGPRVLHRVLPDNCIDMLWQDSAPEGGVAGMMSSAIEVPFAAPVRTIAVRFKPGAAACFFDLPLHELCDLHPPLADLWGPGVARQFADALWSRPLADIDALGVLQRLLLQRLRPTAPGLAEHALAALQASHGALRIATLAATLGVSRQHLASQFRHRVGLSAKQFARVCRFQAGKTRLENAGPGPFDVAALALELGYYDQPHMIHEFQSLAARTPQSFIAST